MSDWLESLSGDVWQWMQTVRIPERPGWIRFCTEDAIFEPGAHTGLGMSCLALKTLHMLGLTERVDADDLRAWIAYIQAFQTQVGYFEDPVLLGHRDRWFRRDIATRRAETRQACAALLCVGAEPLHPLNFTPKEPREVRRYIRRQPWQNPWAAGSHTGHLMAFLHINAENFADTASKAELLPVVLKELDTRQDPNTGCWREKHPTNAQLINGAMKVITGYDFVGLPFNYSEQLIDFALGLSNDQDACHHADLIYVLHQCSRLTDHRRDDIERVAAARLNQIKAFRKPDGGFSFRAGGTGTHYYGVPMSKGSPVSDVHGTTLFVWTAVMIADLLGRRAALGWRLPIT